MLFYLALIFIIIYYLLKRQHSYWNRKGIPQIEPKFFFGNIKEVVLQEATVSKIVKNAYYDFKRKNKKHGGIYLLYTPVWMLIDRELIKQIMIKDYPYFDSHGFFCHEKDPMSVHLFNVQGSEWKELRAKLSPTFSTAKIKMMFDIVNILAERIEKKVDALCESRQPIEIKETAACFGIDAIAACFFGINCDCLNEPENEFRQKGKIIFEPRPINILLEQMVNWDLLGHLGYSFSPKEINTFFTNIAKDSIEYREKNNVTRNDYLQLLIQLKNKGKLDDDDSTETGFLTFNQVAANMLAMYAASFETSSSTTAFLLYELAKNQEIQDKVREEILRLSHKRPGHQILYEDLAEMKYCDMCITETLRRYTPLPEIPRRCTRTYRIPGTDQIIEKGTMVMIPAWVIHTDPEYYPDPLKFNPENFSTESKNARPDFTFFGFGEGPRLCIGYRFALMQIKTALVKYLSKYKYTLNPKTPEELTYKPNAITLTAKEDILLDISKIN